MKFTEGAFRDWGYEQPPPNSATTASLSGKLILGNLEQDPNLSAGQRPHD